MFGGAKQNETGRSSQIESDVDVRRRKLAKKASQFSQLDSEGQVNGLGVTVGENLGVIEVSDIDGRSSRQADQAKDKEIQEVDEKTDEHGDGG